MSKKTVWRRPKPRRDPEVERHYRLLVGALTGADEGGRTAALAWLVGLHDSYSLGRVSEMLVGVLGRRTVSRHTPAVASLVGIGTPAIPALLGRLWRAKEATLRARLLEVIGSIGPRLAYDERFTLLMDLNIMCTRDLDESVRRSFFKTAAHLRVGGILSPDRGTPGDVP